MRVREALAAARTPAWSELTAEAGRVTETPDRLAELVGPSADQRARAGIALLRMLGSGNLLASIAAPVTNLLLDLLVCDEIPEPRLLLGVLGHIVWTVKETGVASMAPLRGVVQDRSTEVLRHASTDATTAAMAGYVLSALPSPDARWITAMLPSLEGPPHAAATGALALGWLCDGLEPREQPTASAALVSLLTHDDPLVRGAAAAAIVLVRRAIPDALRPSLRDALSAPRITDELAEEVGASLAFPWGGGSLPVACAHVFETVRDPIRTPAGELLIEALARTPERPKAPSQPF